ncbi:anti-sigma-V factor rsiV [Anaerotignum lactatifermentans]|uniref:anti-sigma-V factor rsiV n=1 Tax=Anaerotignum lactatifermentans TaxID=160404 RepID=UPI00174B67B6|nr:anti-sigma-V factor rsiV [Anaerotignum lactatifermentans]HJE93835.1 anti-sigma-V factor rsiV [Anaerotignum lactatifermentans]
MKTQDDHRREPMEMWKEEYDQIPVPQEARDKIEAGIMRARLEKKRSDRMKNMKRTGVTAAALVLTFGIAVNASPVVAQAMDGIPVIGSIARVVTIRNYNESTDNGMMADISVPQIDGNVAANAEMDAYAKELIARYEKEVVAQLGQEEGHYALESSYEVVSDNDKYVSIRINTVETMASGAEFVKIFTVDKATGQTVSLKDYLNSPEKLEAVSQNIKDQMAAQMAEDEGKVYFTEGEVGGFTGLTGDENFYLNEAGELVIVFGEYEVAPGYMGTVSFTIPKDVTK